MFKKLFGGIGRVVKPFVNFPAWMGWKYLSANNERLKKLASTLYPSTKEKIQPETFESAMIRLELNEFDLKLRQQHLGRMAKLYTVLAILIFAYAVYLLVHVGTWIGFLTANVLTIAVLAIAFKNHFWYTQIKERRLGLRFWDWLYLTVSKKNSSAR